MEIPTDCSGKFRRPARWSSARCFSRIAVSSAADSLASVLLDRPRPSPSGARALQAEIWFRTNMPSVDRNNPKRSTASESSYSLMEFMREYPDDATCLEWLWRQRCSDDGSHALCPKCKQTRRFHKVKSRPSWSCDSCGHHMHPTAGTIFHGSATSLQLWFYAMYLMTSTRCAVSAKHLERELGVTYKVAWRMANKIRNELMHQDDEPPLSGDVEADETWMGGKPRLADQARGRRRAEAEGRPWRAGVYSQRP